MVKRLVSAWLIVMVFVAASAIPVLAASNDETDIVPGIIYNHGDVNLDGNINIKDVTYIQKYLANIYTFTPKQQYLADVDGKAGVNIKDATYMQKWLAYMVAELFEPDLHQDSTPATDDSPVVLPFVPAN